MDVNISEWVKLARLHKNLTQEELALEVGFSSKASISAIERGRSHTTLDIILKISQVCSYPLPYQNVFPLDSKDSSSGNIQSFPLYNSEDAFSIIKGGTSMEYENRVDIPTFVLERVQLENKNTICLLMEGNSMLPVIPNGSLVILDSSSKNIIDGQYYAVLYGNLLRIRRIFKLPNDLIKLSAHNNLEYPDETVEKKEIEILGFVVSWTVFNR